ncbi:MAG: c-type cytochrome [Dongiaceae bacterium]
MSKFPRLAISAVLALSLFPATAFAAGDAVNGEKLFKRCATCHTIGEGAKHKVGPQLNDVIGRVAGSAEGYSYSKAMVAVGKAGTIWSVTTLDAYLTKPKDFVKGTKMAFAGLAKESERTDIIAYLRGFSKAGEIAAPASAAAVPDAPATTDRAGAPQQAMVAAAKDSPLPTHGVFHLGRLATPAEIAAWDIDVRPDGLGLPEGKGTAAQGEVIFGERCASCHGDFGEGRDRWPVLAGGLDTLTSERPNKTIGSYWPYLSTVYDYVRRAMPFGDARSLTNDEVYAITAYLLYLNEVVDDENFELSKENFTSIHLPNEQNFIVDDRNDEAHNANRGEPCMTACKPAPAQVVKRAQVLDVTPDSDQAEQAGGAVE